MRAAASFVPRAFQSLGALRALNVASVGLALAAATGAALSNIMAGSGGSYSFGLFSAIPTLVLGAVWAALLRHRGTVGRSSVRWGWLASVPLAMLNGALACAFLAMSESSGNVPEKFLLGAMIGATIGAIIWIPGLIATLVAFGVPIAWSQKLAKQGLAGEERGEIVIGGASTLVSLFAVLLLLGVKAYDMPSRNEELEPIGQVLLWILSGAGAATGAAAATLALLREARRKRFVKEVALGNVAGFRVDDVPEGKVLVRVTSMGQGYRVANFEEALLTLDQDGEAKQAMQASL